MDKELVKQMKEAVSGPYKDPDPETLKMSEEDSKLIEHSANQGKYYPERYINADEKEIRQVLKDAIRRQELKFAKQLINELAAHGRKPSLIKELRQMLREAIPSKRYDNPEYLATFSKEELIEIGYSIGLQVSPKLTSEQMINVISEYYRIHKVSREIG